MFQVPTRAVASAGCYSAVSLGSLFGLGLETDGTVATWGANDYGSLGYGSLYSGGPRTILPPAKVPGLSGITAVAAGQAHALALQADGTVLAWGNNIAGQLGNGAFGWNSPHFGSIVTPTPVSNLSNVVQVAARTAGSMAIDSSGTLWAWGDNTQGQAGQGTATGNSNLPGSFVTSASRVLGPNGVGFLDHVIAAAPGEFISAALRSDGTAWTWGGFDPGASQYVVTPVQVAGLGNVTSIVGGQYQAYAVRSDGSVWSWNAGGSSLTQVQGVTAVTQLSVGRGFALALKTDGTVWGWGNDYNGELLDPSLTVHDTPIALQGLSNVVRIAAGDYGAFATKADGSIVGWGADQDGELGLSIPAGYTATPVALGCATAYGTGGGVGPGSPQLNLAMQAPSALAVSGWTYSPNPFTVTATVQNSGTATAHGTQVAINIAPGSGLALVAGSSTVAIGDLAAGSTVTQSWQIRAGSSDADRTANYSVALTATDASGTSSNQSVALPKMKSALIFVPGVAGSELQAGRSGSQLITNSQGVPQPESYVQGDTVWINISKTLVDSEYFDLLRFGNDGNPLYNDFYPDGKMIEIGGGFYSGIEAFFTSPTSGYTKGKDFFVFTYDWRYGAETNVDGLDLVVANALAAGAPSVDIVGHSMGTQVTRAWLLSGTNRNHVNHVIMLAPPNFGTPKGTYAALGGTCLAMCLLPEWVVKYIFSTLPGGFDQAVTPNYWSYYDGSDKAHPVPYIDKTVSPRRTDYQDLRNHELAEGASPAAVAAGEAFHSSDLSWPANVAGKLSLFAGSGKCTIGQITANRHQWPPLVGPVTTQYDYGEINGDGTVTLGSASMGGGTLGGGNYSLYYRDGTHEDMAHRTDILTDALHILRDQAVDPGHPSGTWPFCQSVSARSPMEIQVTDAAGNQLGGLTPDQNRLQLPGGNFDRFKDMKIATVTSPGQYRVDLAGSGTGDSTIEVRTYQDPNGLAKDTIWQHVPTTPNTKGSFTFDGSTGLAGAMTLDVNGDGKTILTLAPIQLTGAAANDTSPPTLTIDSPAANQAVVGDFPVKWSASDSESGVGVSQAYVDLIGSRQLLTAPATLQLPAGQHTIDAYAEDMIGNATTTHRDFVADAFAWQPPLGAAGFGGNAGRTLPVKFTITTPGGIFVNDSSVAVDLLDANGTIVAGPMTYAPTPDAGVAVLTDGSGSTYQANLRTSGLPPGTYSVRVRFSSASLLGQLTLSIQLT